jgi:phosphoribosyl-ATP pyrophosphohydrolase
MLYKLYEILKDRQDNPKAGSYTNQLLEEGLPQIMQKVGEEAVEVIVAASSQGKQRVVEETSDLIYHLYVLLVQQGIPLSAIEDELGIRHRIERN